MRRSLLLLLVAGAVAALWSITARQATPDPVRPEVETPAATATADRSAAPATAGAIAPSALPDQKREAVVVGPQLRMLHGRVTRRGHPVAGRRVECKDRDGWAEWDTTTASDGTYAFRLPPGRYTVTVPMRTGRPVERPRFGRDYRGPPGEGPIFAARRQVELEDTDQRCNIALPTGAIVVRAIDAVTFQPVPDVRLSWQPPPPMLQNLEIESATGSARIDDVPDGPQRIAATRRAYARQTSEVFEIGGEAMVIELRMRPVGALDVVLVDALDRPIPLTRDHEIDVRHVATYRAAHAGNRDAIRDRRRRDIIDRLVYDNLQPGPHRITLGGDEYSFERTRVEFAPVTLAPAAESRLTVEIEAGQLAEVRIPVRPRTKADLQPLDRWGNLTEGRLYIDWLDPATGPVEVKPYPSSVRGYRGYLAPGTYSIRIEGGDQTRTERLVVGDDGAPVKRGYRLQ